MRLVADEFAGEAKALAAALLRARLENNFIVAHGLNDVPALVNRERERLLAVHIFFRLGRPDVDERVPMVRRRLHDGVNVVAFQHLAEVAVCRGSFAVFREPPRRLARIFLVHVAHRQNVAE